MASRSTNQDQTGGAEEFSQRQCEVLDAALELLVAGGDRLSMIAIARAASCSKETLYNWFGDRDGVLAAIVRRQASKVRMPEMPKADLTLERLRGGLEEFAANWIMVVTSEVSVSLNRMAISHAGSGKSRLGEIVLLNGPYAMRRRLEPIFVLGREIGLLDFASLDEVSMRFFGLVVADIQIRALLGESRKPNRKHIAEIAGRAVSQFMWLYGAANFQREYSIHQTTSQT